MLKCSEVRGLPTAPCDSRLKEKERTPGSALTDYGPDGRCDLEQMAHKVRIALTRSRCMRQEPL